ncbi:hypothetical protein IFT84_17615 [Rhizobium sp. CFBP 8762]|uniref:hypothetical protein n=1 Tax=Rhizobium sp. CFBP 8762 TaxID=2775279 RepID=UPI001787620F|nr:hypothetical protein [Rhizobium sp. CFBP 8762]MBD8556329.1 hypothetical protein [Rhizobium sp. CFBP 8762]
MKPWLSEPRGRQLEAFVGVWGIKTSRYESTSDLVLDARLLFGLAQAGDEGFWSVEETAEAIEALGKKERVSRAWKNLCLVAIDTDDAPTVSAVDAPITSEALEKMMADSKPKLIDGADMDCSGELDIDPAKLLRKVVSAVISGGQGHILYDFPEVLAFFGSRIPSRSELSGHTAVDERMFEAKANWPNLKPGALI